MSMLNKCIGKIAYYTAVIISVVIVGIAVLRQVYEITTMGINVNTVMMGCHAQQGFLF